MDKQNNPKVSIIVPVYNVEAYLNQCIQSLIDQTYQNIEIILVNDGSTDRSGEICDSFGLQEKRIKVIHKQNEGVGKARNEGIKNASGDYISFVDADDWLEPNLFEHCFSAINPKSVDIYQYGYNKVTKVGTRFGQIVPPSLIIDNLQLEKTPLTEVLDSGTGLAVWDKLIKRKLITKNNIWFDNKKRGEDFTFVFRLLSHAKSIVSIAKPFYNYRIVYGSSAKFDPEITKNHTENYKHILSFFGKTASENKATQRFLLRLAVLWFLIVIPLNISKTSTLNRKEKITWLRQLHNSNNIKEWLLKSRGITKGFKEKILLFIYRLNSPYLLYITARFLSFLRRNFNLSS